MGLYIALSRTPDIDCYWVGAVPKVEGCGTVCSPLCLLLRVGEAPADSQDALTCALQGRLTWRSIVLLTYLVTVVISYI